jgi:hypothetical protein
MGLETFNKIGSDAKFVPDGTVAAMNVGERTLILEMVTPADEMVDAYVNPSPPIKILAAAVVTPVCRPT